MAKKPATKKSTKKNAARKPVNPNQPIKPSDILPGEIQMDIEAQRAQEILRKKAQRDAQMCSQEIQQILTKYQCRIDAQVLLAEGTVRPIINIVKDLRPQGQMPGALPQQNNEAMKKEG
jgi:hypothetical protein